MANIMSAYDSFLCVFDHLPHALCLSLALYLCHCIRFASLCVCVCRRLPIKPYFPLYIIPTINNTRQSAEKIYVSNTIYICCNKTSWIYIFFGPFLISCVGCIFLSAELWFIASIWQYKIDRKWAKVKNEKWCHRLRLLIFRVIWGSNFPCDWADNHQPPAQRHRQIIIIIMKSHWFSVAGAALTNDNRK